MKVVHTLVQVLLSEVLIGLNFRSAFNFRNGAHFFVSQTSVMSSPFLILPCACAVSVDHAIHVIRSSLH